MKKEIGIILKRVFRPALHKYDLGIYHISYICVYILCTCVNNEKMRIWSNGKISLCQGEDAGSIPAIRTRSRYINISINILIYIQIIIYGHFFNIFIN